MVGTESFASRGASVGLKTLIFLVCYFTTLSVTEVYSVSDKSVVTYFIESTSGFCSNIINVSWPYFLNKKLFYRSALLSVISNTKFQLFLFFKYTGFISWLRDATPEAYGVCVMILGYRIVKQEFASQNGIVGEETTIPKRDLNI